jgi:hypothetical protein
MFKYSDEMRPLVTSMNGACRALDVGPDRLYDLINAGLIESYLDGSKRKVVIASIERYIADGVKESKKSKYAGAALRRKRSDVTKNTVPAHEA